MEVSAFSECFLFKLLIANILLNYLINKSINIENIFEIKKNNTRTRIIQVKSNIAIKHDETLNTDLLYNSNVLNEIKFDFLPNDTFDLNQCWNSKTIHEIKGTNTLLIHAKDIDKVQPTCALTFLIERHKYLRVCIKSWKVFQGGDYHAV